MFSGHKIFAAEEMFDIFDLDKDDKLGEEHYELLTEKNSILAWTWAWQFHNFQTLMLPIH